MTHPTKAQATQAARDFIRLRDRLPQPPTKADLMMGLGRLYEFPPGTPAFTGKATVGAISAFILEHAVAIE